MKIDDHNNLLKGLISVAGVISASFLLSLPALALLQSEATSARITSEDEQLLAQDNSGDNDNGGSDNSDNGNNGGDGNDGSDGSDNGGDSNGDSSANSGGVDGNDGDSGENFRTRGESAGGAPFIGVGESMNDEDPTSR